MTEPEPSEALEELLRFVRDSRGFDFTGYKRTSLRRRFDRRLATVGVDSYERYHEYLAGNPDEFAQLFDTILINVTSFFRDPSAWEYVSDEIVPRILLSTDAGPIRIWSTGCASGE